MINDTFKFSTSHSPNYLLIQPVIHSVNHSSNQLASHLSTPTTIHSQEPQNIPKPEKRQRVKTTTKRKKPLEQEVLLRKGCWGPSGPNVGGGKLPDGALGGPLKPENLPANNGGMEEWKGEGWQQRNGHMDMTSSVPPVIPPPSSGPPGGCDLWLCACRVLCETFDIYTLGSCVMAIVLVITTITHHFSFHHSFNPSALIFSYKRLSSRSSHPPTHLQFQAASNCFLLFMSKLLLY